MRLALVDLDTHYITGGIRPFNLIAWIAFPIKPVGEKTIQEFFDEGWLHSPADLFNLPAREADIAKREGWGELSARNLSRAIRDGKRSFEEAGGIFSSGSPDVILL